MLKDRRALMIQEMIKQKQACGQLYKWIIIGQASAEQAQQYDSMKLKLADMMAEIAIVDQMIEDGNK